MLAEITQLAPAYVQSNGSMVIFYGLLRLHPNPVVLKRVPVIGGDYAIDEAGSFWHVTWSRQNGYRADCVDPRALHEWELREVLSTIQETLLVK
jgi:hypothetical protein